MFYFLSFSLLNFLFSRPEKGKKKKKHLCTILPITVGRAWKAERGTSHSAQSTEFIPCAGAHEPFPVLSR
jgi:hypothetical protein